MNDTVLDPQALPEAVPPAAEAAPVRRKHRRMPNEALFDGGDTLLDDGLTRANWAVPWSDLMMTMFVLFAALLVAQALHERSRQQTAVAKQVQEHEKPIPAEVAVPKPSFEPLMQINVLERSKEAVREANLENAEIVLMKDQSVKVSVQGPMFFALGKADLRPEVARFLDRLALLISQTPYDIHVVGHTDDQPINSALFPSNWELSLVRASHVARYLIKSGNIDPARFVVMGRGEYEPVAGNDDARARALNRRVEIIITRDVSKNKEGSANE
jgi:chemotaxis protein MotB